MGHDESDQQISKPEETIVFHRRGDSVVADYSDQACVTSTLF